MSAITREEIEKIILKYEGIAANEPGGRGFWQSHDFIIACRAGDEIAALVEERMKEMVCAVCGESSSDGDCCNYRTQVAPVTRAEREVRAQYEAEKGEEGR